MLRLSHQSHVVGCALGVPGNRWQTADFFAVFRINLQKGGRWIKMARSDSLSMVVPSRSSVRSSPRFGTGGSRASLRPS